ncbi:MAG TPA: hypothetical protein DEG71_08095 [Clostridiales bacterium]|nr:hypothetical protein [Clostridiales bacterium]
MEFIKVKDITKLVHEVQEIGYIQTERNKEGKATGYKIRFYAKIWGYDYGDYTKTYKNALKIAERNYTQMLEGIGKNKFYNQELDMWFPNKEKCDKYNDGNIVAEERRKEVLKRTEGA